MTAPTEIQDFAGRVAKAFRPERIVLFGSHAFGKATEGSDVDMLVVVKHEGKPWDEAARIRARAKPPFSLDLLLRTPKQVRARLALGDPFLSEILHNGKILYEAHHR